MPIYEALQDPSVYVHMESLEALVVFPCKKKYLLNIILWLLNIIGLRERKEES